MIYNQTHRICSLRQKNLREAGKMLAQIYLTVSLCALFTGFCTPQAVSRWPLPNDCHGYYETRLFDCPPEFHWNSQLQQCDLQTTAGCSSIDPMPNGNNLYPQNSDLAKLCENKLKHLIPYPGNCSQYIQCDYLPFVMPCPQYLFWNSQLLTCDKICI